MIKLCGLAFLVHAALSAWLGAVYGKALGLRQTVRREEQPGVFWTLIAMDLVIAGACFVFG